MRKMVISGSVTWHTRRYTGIALHHWFASITNTLLFATATIFVAGLLFAILARQFRQSPLIGYLLAGLVIGPHVLRLVPDEANIHFLADVGVVFLMFSLGVQLSLRHLQEVKSIAIFGGLAQIILLILIGAGIGGLLGLPLGAVYCVGLRISVKQFRSVGAFIRG